MRVRSMTFGGAACLSLFLYGCASNSSDGPTSPQPDSGTTHAQDSGMDATVEDTNPPPEDTSPPVDTGSMFTIDSSAKDSATEASSEDAPAADAPAETSTTDAMTTEAGSRDGGTVSDGGVPTTCAQAYGTVGCCSASGEVYYCESSSTTVKSKTCTGGEVCGWNATSSYYGCVAPPSTADPSGANPIDCK